MKHYNEGELTLGTKITKIFRKLPIVFYQNGFLQSLKLINIYFILPLLMPSILFYSKNLIKIKRFFRKTLVQIEFRKMLSVKEDFLDFEKKKFVNLSDIGLSLENIEKIKKKQVDERIVAIGDFDHDGYLLSFYGKITEIPNTTKENFLKKNKFKVSLVYNGETVAIKKEYSGNKVAFINELKALHYLGKSNINVPSIIEIDFENLVLIFSFILGHVLREELAGHGAIVRDRDISGNENFSDLDSLEKWQKRIDEGRAVLEQVVDKHFINTLYDQIFKIHSNKFILNDIKYGNIIIEKNTGKPYIIDFEQAEQYPKMKLLLFRGLKDFEINLFNKHFNTQKISFDVLKKKIKKTPRNNIYAPTYFGSGLKFGDIWNVGAGYGRWYYLLKNNLPNISGAKILDLGANNGCNALQILRNGAREAVAIEYDKELVKQGSFVKKSYEWADNKEYKLDLRHANMKDIVTMNLGNFDIVTAFCAIYYLEDREIKELVRYISTITDTFILQCNIAKNIGRSSLETQRKASIEYTEDFLKEAGFKNIKVVAPYKYDRPLVIGQK